jgi:pyruvate formate lyase activating enzyme
VHDEDGGSTYCPSCEKQVIARDWYEIPSYRLSDEGACTFCGAKLAGHYGKFGKPFGSRRIPVRLSATA